MTKNNFIRKFFYGDNLNVLKNKIENNSIDLIYIDPPFNSKKITLNLETDERKILPRLQSRHQKTGCRNGGIHGIIFG